MISCRRVGAPRPAPTLPSQEGAGMRRTGQNPKRRPSAAASHGGGTAPAQATGGFRRLGHGDFRNCLDGRHAGFATCLMLPFSQPELLVGDATSPTQRSAHRAAFFHDRTVRPQRSPEAVDDLFLSGNGSVRLLVRAEVRPSSPRSLRSGCHSGSRPSFRVFVPLPRAARRRAARVFLERQQESRPNKVRLSDGAPRAPRVTT